MADVAIHRMTTYRTTVCIICGVDIVLSAERYDYCLKEHTSSFFCPNGHSQHFVGETEEARLRRVLADREAQLAVKERALKFERERLSMVEKREQKLKKRIAAGVCPCCHRTVGQLARHMKTKHPEFSVASSAKPSTR